MLKIQVKVDGLDAIQRSARASVKALGRPLMLGIDRIMRAQVVKTFRDERDPVTGAAWPKTGALALSTRLGSSNRTLYATGGLHNSILGAAPQVTNDSVTLGTNKPYAEAQFGKGGADFKILPKNGKYLAIPATKAAARIASWRGQWVKRWFAANPTGVWLFGRGGIYGFGFRRKDGTPVVHGILKTSIKIPRRPFLGIGPAYAKEIEEFTRGAIERSMGGQP